MTKLIDLFEELEYAVTLSHAVAADLGPGTLTFGANEWARVDLRDSTKTRDLVEGTTWPIIKAKTEEGQTFTLCDCVIRGRSLYADYVILGNVNPGDLQEISIRYTDISEWISNWQRLDGELGDRITWVNKPKPLSVTVPSEQIAISTKAIGSLERKGEDHVLHEHIEFVVEKNSGAFSPNEIQKATLELSCLFSILLSHPISLVSVAVAAKGFPSYQIYFPGFKKIEKTLSNDGYMTKCFSQATSSTCSAKFSARSPRNAVLIRPMSADFCAAVIGGESFAIAQSSFAIRFALKVMGFVFLLVACVTY